MADEKQIEEMRLKNLQKLAKQFNWIPPSTNINNNKKPNQHNTNHNRNNHRNIVNDAFLPTPKKNLLDHSAFLDLCSSDENDDNDIPPPINNSHNSNNTNNNHNINNSDNNNYNNYNNNSIISIPETPQLIKEERKRLEKQRQLDREVAMNLQKQLEQKQSEFAQPQNMQSDHAIAMNLQREMEMEHNRQNLANDHQIAFDMQSEMNRINNELQQQLMHRNRNINRVRMQNQFIERREYNHNNNNNNNNNIIINNNNRFGFDDLNVSNMDYEELLDMFPTESHGAKEETINRLPTDTFKNNNNNIEESESEKNKCLICLEKFKDGEEIRRLQCLHIFHKDEIDSWLRINRACPICRINIEDHL